MKNRQNQSFSAYELVKMALLITDSMNKIEKVLERLQMADDRKNAMLLIQALDNLSLVEAKLSGLSRAKARQQAKKVLKQAEEILGEK